MLRRALALTVALAAVIAGLLVAASTWPSGARADEPAGAVVLIGTGGIGWSDVDEQTTPNLWQMLRDGSSAALSVRSVYSNTCPIDGWLGVSAGARAAAPRPGTARNPADRPCPGAPAVANGSVLQWPAYLAAAADERFDSRLGLLGDTAALGKVCVKAVEPFATAGAFGQGRFAGLGADPGRGAAARAPADTPSQPSMGQVLE